MAVEVSAAGGVELSLAVVVGGWLAGVLTGAGVALGSGIDGAEATAPVALASELGIEDVELAAEGAELAVEGVELGAGSVFKLGGLLVLAAAEPCVSALMLALAGDEREDESRLERLEVLLLAVLDGAFAGFTLSVAGGDAVAVLRLGACGVAALDSGSAIAVLVGVGTGAVEAALLASATTGARVLDGAAVLSVSLRL